MTTLFYSYHTIDSATSLVSSVFEEAVKSLSSKAVEVRFAGYFSWVFTVVHTVHNTNL